MEMIYLWMGQACNPNVHTNVMTSYFGGRLMHNKGTYNNREPTPGSPVNRNIETKQEII